MSDDLGLAWKLSFGAMVLAFSGIVMMVRKPPPVVTPVPAHTAAVIQSLPLLEMPVNEATATFEAVQPAPPESVEDGPVRIQVSLFDPLPRLASATATAKPDQRAAPRPHLRRGPPTAKPKAASPPNTTARRARIVILAQGSATYTARRPHYPFNPRDRWRTGEQDFAPGR